MLLPQGMRETEQKLLDFDQTLWQTLFYLYVKSILYCANVRGHYSIYTMGRHLINFWLSRESYYVMYVKYLIFGVECYHGTSVFLDFYYVHSQQQRKYALFKHDFDHDCTNAVFHFVLYLISRESGSILTHCCTSRFICQTVYFDILVFF